MDMVSMLNLILIVILIAILLLGIIAVLLVFRMRNKKNTKNDTITIKQPKERENLITRDGKEIDSIYKFMEFDEIQDNMIIRKNRKQYVMVIKCKGINYDLLSEDEKNAVESGFIEFLNTLRFPIQLYVQTRTLNFSDLINGYNARIEDVQNQITKLRSQLEVAKKQGNNELIARINFEIKRKQNILEYGESITNYTEKIGSSKNILQQKTYIILSYYTAEFGDTNTYSKEEINDIAFSELYTRAQTLIRALASAEVAGTVLNSEELMELLYIAYNRDESEVYTLRNALNSEYNRLYSTAKDVMEEKKKRIEAQIENEATKMATKSIINADKKIREERIKEQKVKQRALEILEENKDEMSNMLYDESKKQITGTKAEESKKSNKRVVKKNI